MFDIPQDSACSETCQAAVRQDIYTAYVHLEQRKPAEFVAEKFSY